RADSVRSGIRRAGRGGRRRSPLRRCVRARRAVNPARRGSVHSLAALCVRRPVFATMLVVSLTVVGIYSFFGLGVEFFPNVDFPTVAVTVSNPGASAEQIENEITKKIEGTVNTINGIDQLQSTSVEGQSTVV